MLPNAGPGLSELDGEPGRDARAIAAGLTDGDLAALYLLQTDPLDELPHPELWEQALERASTVVAHASFLTDGLRAYANVVFPAEVYAEKEGTIVHPDGRIQRLRPAVGRAGGFGSSRAGWQVLADLAARLDLDLGVLTGSMASQQLFDAVPFYAGLTLEEIGGRGVRWQERRRPAAFPSPEHERRRAPPPSPRTPSRWPASARCGTRRGRVLAGARVPLYPRTELDG